MSSALWLVGAMTIVGVVVVLMTWYRRDRTADLGTVSHQWIAEQRLEGRSDRHGG